MTRRSTILAMLKVSAMLRLIIILLSLSLVQPTATGNALSTQMGESDDLEASRMRTRLAMNTIQEVHFEWTRIQYAFGRFGDSVRNAGIKFTPRPRPVEISRSWRPFAIDFELTFQSEPVTPGSIIKVWRSNILATPTTKVDVHDVLLPWTDRPPWYFRQSVPFVLEPDSMALDIAQAMEILNKAQGHQAPKNLLQESLLSMRLGAFLLPKGNNIGPSVLCYAFEFEKGKFFVGFHQLANGKHPVTWVPNRIYRDSDYEKSHADISPAMDNPWNSNAKVSYPRPMVPSDRHIS